jgi:hypothetical protein
MAAVRARARFGLPLCKRGIEGDLLLAEGLLGREIKIKSKSPLTPLFQRGECHV